MSEINCQQSLLYRLKNFIKFGPQTA